MKILAAKIPDIYRKEPDVWQPYDKRHCKIRWQAPIQSSFFETSIFKMRDLDIFF